VAKILIGDKPMKKIPEWIIVKYNVRPQIFYCSRCGGSRELHLPAPIDDFVKQAEAFAESHKYCKEKK